MDLTLREGVCFTPLQAKALYDDAGWKIYTEDMSKLMQAMQQSLCVISAWDNDVLVGLIRVVGDGLTVLYIQDILVLRSYKRCGVGSDLLNHMLRIYATVRQKVLLTDDSPETRGFYEANGFMACDRGGLVSFARFD
jgi:ribosomal protein S18 acetylase RimI-like enzyme